MLDALAALLKTLLYAGILSGAGAAFAEATLRPASRGTQWLSQAMRRGALLTIVAALASAACLFIRLGGEFNAATLSAMLSSPGAAMGLQIAGAVLLLVSIGGDSFTRSTRLSNAALMTASFAFGGHAAAAGLTGGLVAFLHVSMAAWWVGSLWLLRHDCGELEPAALAELVRRFSAIASGLVGGLIIAGLLLIGTLVDFSRDPWLSAYGQLLAVKIGLAIVLLGAASYNKFRLTPRLATGDSIAVRALRRMISTELACIGAVLVTTAILTTYTSPHE